MKDKDSFRPGPDEAVRIKNKTVTSPFHCSQELLSRNDIWARSWVLRAPMAVTMAQTLMPGRMAMARLIFRVMALSSKSANCKLKRNRNMKKGAPPVIHWMRINQERTKIWRILTKQYTKGSDRIS
jgi:hypothetical protein